MDIIIPNKEELNKKIATIKAGGVELLHVVADFDRTLTKAATADGRINTSYAHLREGDYLSKEYHELDKQLFAEYHPYEIDPDVSEAEKDIKMVEWWSKHYALFIKMGMRREIIDAIVKDRDLTFRKGADSFFRMVKDDHIPLLIFSAGMGDIIRESLKKEGFLSDNVHIFANFFRFDDRGNAIGYNTPLIHAFNKNEQQVGAYTDGISDRTNVILLGDSLGDICMADGLHHDCIIKIGFFDHKDQKMQDQYEDVYDVVILDDGPMDYINRLLKSVI